MQSLFAITWTNGSGIQKKKLVQTMVYIFLTFFSSIYITNGHNFLRKSCPIYFLYNSLYMHDLSKEWDGLQT